jgi:hypothetical protein
MLISQESDMHVFDRLLGSGSDRKHINVTKDDELAAWARRLGATKDQVRVAIAAVGNEPDKIDAYLKRRWSTRGWATKGSRRA